MATPYEDKATGRNICLRYSSNGTDWYYRYFYAHRKIITVEEEEIRGEKKLVSGEIRVRNKKRRLVELEFLFFDGFNELVDTYNPGYDDFEKVINGAFLRFEYNTEIDSECPYKAPDVFARNNTANVFVKEKKIEYVDGLIEKKSLKLTLKEAKNWYA